MPSAFSSNDVEVLSRETDPSVGATPVTSSELLERVYEMKKSIAYIQENGSSHVALQFPDYLLPDAAKVARELQSRTSAEFFVLADTSYGSYDVDEVAAQHIQADLIIHYGKAAVTANTKTPTLYVFGGRDVDVESVCDSFAEQFRTSDVKVCIFADVSYCHVLGAIKKRLSKDYAQIAVAKLQVPEQPSSVIKSDLKEDFCTNSCPDCSCRLSGNNEKPKVARGDASVHRFEAYEIVLDERSAMDDYSLFFIGSSESETLRNYLLKHPSCKGYSFDPQSKECCPVPTSISRALMRRYYVMEKVRDAGTVGILVGTMGMAGFRDIIKHLKNILKLSGKKSYTFVVGKLNPQKLANFPEVDVFVLVACPEESIVDSASFYKPIATPFEVEVACNSNREWGESYVTDFTDLLPGGRNYVDFLPRVGADVSLVSGKLRDTASLKDNDTPSADGQLETVKDKALEIFHPHSSARFYADRSWKGLEQKVGETAISDIQEGRSGIPMTYRNEL